MYITIMNDLWKSICMISDDIESLYAFSFSQQLDYPKDYGWDMHDTRTEYLRMGVPNEHWVLSNINVEYEVSAVNFSFIILIQR